MALGQIGQKCLSRRHFLTPCRNVRMMCRARDKWAARSPRCCPAVRVPESETLGAAGVEARPSAVTAPRISAASDMRAHHWRGTRFGFLAILAVRAALYAFIAKTGAPPYGRRLVRGRGLKR
jgi:hypothetical protein